MAWEITFLLYRSVIATMKYKAHDLSGKLSINGLTGLLSRCTLIIANDSGSSAMPMLA